MKIIIPRPWVGEKKIAFDYLHCKSVSQSGAMQSCVTWRVESVPLSSPFSPEFVAFRILQGEPVRAPMDVRRLGGLCKRDEAGLGKRGGVSHGRAGDFDFKLTPSSAQYRLMGSTKNAPLDRLMSPTRASTLVSLSALKISSGDL